MTDTPTPAQQLEDFVALRKAATTALANNESATAFQLEDDAADIARDLVRDHADTLRRALAALEAVEAAKRFSVSEDACGSIVSQLTAMGYYHGQRVLIIPADAVEVKS